MTWQGDSIQGVCGAQRAESPVAMDGDHWEGALPGCRQVVFCVRQFLLHLNSLSESP